MDGLFRLAYVSTAQPGLTDHDMERLINESQSNNNERFITGYLVHNGQNFMQLIEGPHEEITGLYARIVRDRRHSGVVRILAEWAERRAFPSWSMNYFRVDMHGSVGTMVARQADSLDTLMEAQAPRELLHMFSKFIQQTEYPEPHRDHPAGNGAMPRRQQQDPRE